MSRHAPIVALAALFLLPFGSLRAQPRHSYASDYPDSSFQLRFGGFFPQGGAELWEGNEEAFTLDASDFDDVIFGFTYVSGVNNNFEIGFNLDYYSQTVRSAYRAFVDQDDFPILHDTRLRLLPATVDFRFLPAGRYAIRGERGRRLVRRPVPYFGIGAGVHFWEYEETGDFLYFPPDPLDPPEVFLDRFTENGTAFEAHVVAGIEFPVSPDWSVLVEARRSWSDVTPGGDFAGLGKLELGGTSAFIGMSSHF